MRLDILLVERGLARSRTHAATLIDSKRVLVSGKEARKSSQTVLEDVEVKIVEATEFVSRAGHKLAGALDAFSDLEILGKLCLDVGASTGGFTDVLLRRGAKQVIAIDVGHSQFVEELSQNPRVASFEGINARDVTKAELEQLCNLDFDKTPIEIVVSDLSFISQTLVLPNILKIAPGADFVILIKPQFEVGKHSLSAHGIVNDHRLRAQAIRQVIDCANSLNMGVRGLVKSDLAGTHGNIEYLLWISASEPRNQQEWSDRIDNLTKEKISK